MSDFHTDFEKYKAQWEKAVEDGVFEDAPKPPKPNQADFFGQYDINPDTPLNEVDVKYWSNVSKAAGRYVDPLVIAERFDEEKSTSKKEPNVPGGPRVNRNPSSFEELVAPSTEQGEQSVKMADKVKVMGTNPNPQQSGNIGQDGFDGDAGTTRVSVGWAAADNSILAVEELKRSLYELETKMSDAEGLSETKIKSLESKMKDLKKQIDDLSNAIPPHFPADHM